MTLRSLTWLLVCTVLGTAPAAAQQAEADADGGKPVATQVQRWKCGVKVTASGGPCMRVIATAPVPIDWPEQQVKVAEEDVSPTAHITYQTVENGLLKLMMVSIGQLPGGQESHALVTLEVRRSAIVPPEKTEQYTKADPKKLDRTVRPFLNPSPLVESRHAKIVAAAKGIAPDEESAWKKVEAIYNYVRQRVQYHKGMPMQGALYGFMEKEGDYTEMTALFVALCRASDIPARTVHVPDHRYPEFYLLDASGTGHWFPCEICGKRLFGGSNELRPILEKGDNFKDPRNSKEHYFMLPETATASGTNRPSVQFVRELLPN